MGTLLALRAGVAEGMEFVVVGHVANTADPTGFGRVDHSYQIGKYEVSVAQYAAFLNAVAATDAHGLYNPLMATDQTTAGIARSGEAASYVYSVIGDGDRPVAYVSWFDAARMANWMHNGRPSGAQDAGTTESGAYPLNGATSGLIEKNAGARFYLPTENEWFKAAYRDPSLNGGAGGYWTYPTRSNVAPGNVVGGDPNQANYYTANSAPEGKLSVTQQSTIVPNQNYLTPGGAFTASASAYGTFDQAGNLYEMTDSLNGANRVRRGGCWWANNSGATLQLSKNGRADTSVTDESPFVGFRLAALASPEIEVERPGGVVLSDGGAGVAFGAVTLGSSVELTLVVRNVGTASLSGLAVSVDGVSAGDFISESPGATLLEPGQSAALTVRFVPLGAVSGARAATLHLTSDDADEGVFDVALFGEAFSTSADADADGLSDWAEHRLAALGFDWTVPQAALVQSLRDGAGAAGYYDTLQYNANRFAGQVDVIEAPNDFNLYTLSQLQALAVGAPLLERDAGGMFTLTLGLQKSNDLRTGFEEFPADFSQISVDAQGRVKIRFGASGNPVFFRVEAR